MSHGAGGKATQSLIEAIFLEAFRNPLLEPLEDGASLTVGDTRLALTTDSYVVSPLFFPGGNIGDLAVNGTVNDLSMTGATPLYLTAGFILEEGFPVEDLTRIVDVDGEGRRRGRRADRHRRHQGGRAGQGRRLLHQHRRRRADRAPTCNLGVAHARPGDAIIVSGPIGDHGVTIMLARGELDIEADMVSDTAPLNGLVAALLDADRRACRAPARRDQGRRGDDTERDRHGRRRRRAGHRGRDPRADRGPRRGRTARHRPDVRRVRGPDGGGRRRGRSRRRARGAARAPARRGGRGDRARSRPSRPASSSCGRLSAAPGSSICWSATRCRESADSCMNWRSPKASWRRWPSGCRGARSPRATGNRRAVRRRGRLGRVLLRPGHRGNESGRRELEIVEQPAAGAGAAARVRARRARSCCALRQRRRRDASGRAWRSSWW